MRHGVGALAAVSVLVSGLLFGAPGAARASDLLTLNNTTAYVDPNVTAAFVTVPNLCLEPYGSQGTTTGCDELGVRAVLAYQRNSPYGDVYYEGENNTVLFDTTAFVPQNPGNVSYGEFSGFSPIFSQHKYDLFGRGGEFMGPFTREELLILAIALPADGTPPQTDPGESSIGVIPVGYVRTIALLALAEHDGVTTFTFGGLTFDSTELPSFTQQMGIADGGKADTINAYCQTLFPHTPAGPPYGFLDWNLCGPDADSPGSLSFATQADIWVPASGAFTPQEVAAYSVELCGASDGSLGLDNCILHEQWIDQVVTGYVEAWEALGGDDHFAQNFRSQLNFDPTVVLNQDTGRIVDQRMEQSVELSGAFTTEHSDPGDLLPGDNQDFVAGRQTFQQALQALGGQDLGGIGQMMSQDVMGFIQECLNCNQLDGGNTDHGFQPLYLELEYQPYQTGWDVVPTIVHGGV